MLPTFAFSTGSTWKEVKQARTSDGATHFWPAMAAQGSSGRESLMLGKARPRQAERVKQRVMSKVSERANIFPLIWKLPIAQRHSRWKGRRSGDLRKENGGLATASLRILYTSLLLVESKFDKLAVTLWSFCSRIIPAGCHWSPPPLCPRISENGCDP